MNEADIHTFLNSVTKEQLVSFLENEVKQNPALLHNLYNLLTPPSQIEYVLQELDFTDSVSKQSSAQEKNLTFSFSFLFKNRCICTSLGK